MEYVLDITTDCVGDCGRALVSPATWTPIPLQSKLEMRTDFAQDMKGLSICHNCYRRGFSGKKSIRSKGDFVEDYLIYRRRSNDDAYIAKLMGLKLASLKRMVERAKGRGEL